MLANRAQYERLLQSGKIRDAKKKEAMIELIVQLDQKLEELDQTMQDQINNPSNRSKKPLSVVTPNMGGVAQQMNKNATISVGAESPKTK